MHLPTSSRTWNRNMIHEHESLLHLGLVATKPVFGVFEKARLKPVSSVTQTILKFEIPLVASLDMILSKKRITKALIRLRGCAGWSAPVLFANHRRQVSSRRGPIYLDREYLEILFLCLHNCTVELQWILIRSFIYTYMYIDQYMVFWYEQWSLLRFVHSAPL